MNQSNQKLRVVDETAASRELELVSEIFHRINRIIPENQDLLIISSKTNVRDALALMEQHGYSQLPVVDGGEVLGVFSYRSFARRAAAGTISEIQREKCAPGDIAVEECLEEFQFARVTDEMRAVFKAMEKDNGLLVGDPGNLQGILTPMDLLIYLDTVASPFVMVSEIELALRALIRLSVTEEDLVQLSNRTLKQLYGTDKVPTKLEEMSFDNYIAIISNGDNWARFEPVFGGNRIRTTSNLKEIGEIRNALFHFKREITVQDHRTLTTHRNWLLLKAKQADVRIRAGGIS